MFKLYYLVDQDGALDGDKTLVGDFESVEAAQDRAATDAVLHFSIEQTQNNGANIAVVFSC